MPATETFWNQMGAYNEATILFQIVLIVLAIILIYLVFVRPTVGANILMKAFLSFAFAWNGIVFFLLYAKNPISTFVGAPLFIIVAVLFFVDIFTNKISFGLPDSTGQRLITALWILLVFSYPLIGFALGHSYPKTCMPLAPCPLTVLAIALITAALPRVDKKVFIALLPWALLGLPKCLGALGCYEDCILFAAGVYGLILIIRNWKEIGKN